MQAAEDAQKARLAADANEKKPLDVQSLHSGEGVEVWGQRRLHAPRFDDVLLAACHHLHSRCDVLVTQSRERALESPLKRLGRQSFVQCLKTSSGASCKSAPEITARAHACSKACPVYLWAITGLGVKRSCSSLCTQTTASTAPLSSIWQAIWVTIPVHCAPGTGGVAIAYIMSWCTPKCRSSMLSRSLQDIFYSCGEVAKRACRLALDAAPEKR